MCLQKALQTLPEKQRMVFNLKYYQEMKYEEMSAVSYTHLDVYKRQVRWGMGRMPECLALFTSMARMKLFPSVSFPFAFFTALSKSDECPMFMQVVSTKVMSYIPSAVRLVNRETSSMVGSGKVSGTNQAPAKACP